MKYRIEYNHNVKDFQDVWNIEEKYLEPSTISTVEQVTKWDNKNNHIHIFIRDIEKNRIVGEITILPLNKEQFSKFMNNELMDTEINEDTLLEYKDNGNYYLLFSAIAIDSEYRQDRMILGLLLKGFYNKLNILKKRNISFLNMCAEGQTLEGQKFIKGFLNLKCKKTTKEGYKLYCFDDEKDFEEWFNIFPDYIKSYNRKFN